MEIVDLSARQWLAAFNAISDAMCLLDTEGKVVLSNAAMRRLMEKQQAEPIEDTCWSLLHGGPSLVNGCQFARMKENRQPETLVLALGERWLKVVVTPLLSEKGELTGAVQIMTDVTESRRSEEILDERMRLASLATDVGMALTRGGTLKQMLQKCSELLVQHLDAAFARIWTLTDTDDFLILQASAGMYTHLNGPHGRIPLSSPLKVPTIARYRRPILTNTVIGDPHISDQEWAKQEGMVAFAGYPLTVDDHLVGVMGMFARRTLNEFVLKALGAVADGIALAIESKYSEEERSRLATAVEQIAESILITDAEGTILYANPAFKRASGYSSQDLFGRSFCLVQDYMCLPADNASILATMRRGEVWRGTISRKKKDGSLCEADATFSPVRDHAGLITNYVIVERDVTHEKQLEAQLRQAQKLEAIGTLAGGIAHDFNNILGIIMGFTELAAFSIPEGDEARSYLKNVLGASHRAKDLIMQILAFSRKSEQERQPTQIGLIIKEALKMLRASLPATIEVKHAIASKGVVLADPIQIHQVLMNLCTNAAHAMRRKGGILDVSLTDIDLDTDFVAEHQDLHPGHYLRLTVKDTGHGIAPAIREHIFDPYYTTKPQGEGTGLGLAVVHGIVKGCGGAILVESEMEKGSTFHVFLPGMKGMAHGNVEAQKPLRVGCESILFVDDEEALVDIGRHMLGHLGYQVTAGTSPIEALEAFRAKPGQFDLVITDMTMPNMTGVELARELMRIRPDIPIILCTGFSELITVEEAKAMGLQELLMKPLILTEMTTTVGRVLDRSRQ